MQLMMLRGRSEIPEDGLVILRKKREAVRFILRPCADVGRGDVADIVHVEAEQRAHFRLLEKSFRAGEAFAAQPIEIDPILPVNRHRSVGW